MFQILIVEDDKELSQLFQKVLEKNGYQDANYFSYVFKRQFGVSPSKYRTAYEKNEK